MKVINEYITKDIIKNKFELVEIYHILDTQLTQFGSVEISIKMKELVDSE